jgi:hypothetical protein
LPGAPSKSVLTIPREDGQFRTVQVGTIEFRMVAP